MRAPPWNSPRTFGIAVIVGCVVFLMLWAAIAPLQGATVSLGLVKVASNRKFVQHSEGGLVKRIFVKDGDSVAEGQKLIELGDIKADANHLLIAELIVLEVMRQQRLDAEQQLMATFSQPLDALRELAPLHDPVVSKRAYQRELKIFNLRRDLLHSQLATYRQQISAIANEQAALTRQVESGRMAASLALEELNLNEALVKDKFISHARLLTLKRSVHEYGSKEGENEALLAQSEQRKNDIALRMATVRSEYQRTAAEEFKDVSGRVVQLREQLRTAEDVTRRLFVTSPASGKVVGLKVNGAGEVAPPREPLMEIVPDKDELIVEAKVGVDSIRHLYVGQAAELRLTAFNSRETPLVNGTLTYVSPDALADPQGHPFYIIQVRPLAESLASAGIPELKPGMAAEVYVLLESRSAFNYLMTPISDTLRHAMREP